MHSNLLNLIYLSSTIPKSHAFASLPLQSSTNQVNGGNLVNGENQNSSENQNSGDSNNADKVPDQCPRHDWVIPRETGTWRCDYIGDDYCNKTSETHEIKRCDNCAQLACPEHTYPSDFITGDGSACPLDDFSLSSIIYIPYVIIYLYIIFYTIGKLYLNRKLCYYFIVSYFYSSITNTQKSTFKAHPFVKKNLLSTINPNENDTRSSNNKSGVTSSSSARTVHHYHPRHNWIRSLYDEGSSKAGKQGYDTNCDVNLCQNKKNWVCVHCDAKVCDDHVEKAYPDFLQVHNDRDKYKLTFDDYRPKLIHRDLNNELYKDDAAYTNITESCDNSDTEIHLDTGYPQCSKCHFNDNVGNSGGDSSASPLDQFSINSILDINFLEHNVILLSNMGLYLITAASTIIVVYIINNNYHKLESNRSTINQESVYATVYSIVINQIDGFKGKMFFPFIFALFVFILSNNLAGMIPYSFAPTAHFIVTFSLSFSMVLGATFLGLNIHVFKFFSILVPQGCPLPLLPLLVLIEFISYIARNVSLGLRLAANVLSGHMLLNILSGFTYNIMKSGYLYFFVALLPLSFIIAFSALEIGIAFIQAQVFVVLSSSYIRDGLNLH